MDYFVKALQEHPELAVFLVLAMGFLIGRLKIGRSVSAPWWGPCWRASSSGS